PQFVESDWILVHDASWPCVPPDALRRLMTCVADDPVGGFLAVPVADTLKRATDHDASRPLPHVRRTESRANLWEAQMPQVFRHGVLRAALALDGSEAMTDEAQAVEALAATGACGRPILVQGSTHNVRITTADDLALATAILQLQEGDSGHAPRRAARGGEVPG
ncbi:MAG: 2-C-methyl-D-erythritol 4-phosphate cytidylyltransferase, partial [Betaproteobacteria bacterium]